MSNYSESASGPKPIAPVWHTILLIAGIVLLSFSGAKQFSGEHAAPVHRMQTYALTVVTEIVMLIWVWFGMRLRRIPFRSIFGNVTGSSTLGIDAVCAAAFWISSVTLLATINATWFVTDALIHHRPIMKNGQLDPAQEKTVHTLTALAPSNMSEIAAWILLCAMAALTEEIVFRGYLQRQFTAWGRGAVAVGVVFSAILFGCAHGYQGFHYMVLLSIYGALFSLLAIFRRNIRAGIFAHAWQDIVAGLGLALLHTKHLV
ncbi:CPBP family intramembrane glutamic endopeptidase [Occallatibacter riparius]|uniref:CPBP family intramembrane metalloprotease n=1 Tax=Occallatibacter riparius TaxID=1002689 RepID=A0A9J7BN02_9BACT|nr:CPBP family intramembrane glutamic endopeptidase [Occallatibacter riparius]UWZ84015.1 CPBP family intramembrane metalloprotease [Occallatibacter riparius]